MLKIKLTPLGKRDHKYYRIVVAEGKSKLQGQYLSLIGTYNPHDPNNTIQIDKELYQSWLSKGAQPTITVKSLVAKIK